MGDDDKATKKKPPKPKLPGKKPPNSDKEATEKYKAATDFLDCKGTTLSLKPGKLDWLGLDITPSATFEQDKTKPGTINIKVELPLGSITLPTSVKDGKLTVDTSSLPLGADDVKEFVDGFNAWLEANGNKLGGATLKDGAVTLTKEAVAVAPEKKEVKGGLLPHVPTWEKAGAVGLLAVGVAFGVGFMNAGDETKTVSAATGNQVARAGTPNLYKAVTTVRVTPPGRPAADAAATSGNRVETVLPLFVKSPHRVELVNVQGKPVDSFVLPVPNEEGTVKGSTERGGTFDCFVNHRQGVNGSPSSGRCAVQPPAPNAAPATNAGSGNPGEVARTTETTEGKPWSLLAIPGVLLFAGGGLVVDEERRRRNDEDGGNGDDGDAGDDDRSGEVGGPDDDGLPPPKLDEVKAKTKALTAQAKDERAFILRYVLDKIKDVNAGRPYKDIVGANCSFCALATESTLAGHPATAPPKPLYPTPVSWWRDYALKTWGQVPGTYKSVDDVTKVLDIWGDGNRGILLMSRPDGTGHAINVVNMGGHVLYIDGQSGKEFTNFDGYSQFVLIRTTK